MNEQVALSLREQMRILSLWFTVGLIGGIAAAWWLT